MGRVLVIDDEHSVRESLRMLLRSTCEVVTADSAAAGLRELAQQKPDLILLDLVMPGGSGLDFLANWREAGADPPVIVLTATRTVESAVEAMRLGARDYMTKPFEVATLRAKVAELLAERESVEAPPTPRDETIAGLLGESDAIRELSAQIRRVADSRATVLLVGESGTGKELVAQAIHDLSGRRGAPFVPVNCAAIPDTLLESELFGHEKGAFTNASARRIGRFEAAHGGTLFLDEIGELGASVQAKLLRALQERIIERLGSAESIAVDTRVIAATHRNLREEIAAGRFREDLYYRINVVPLVIPPLRDRKSDIPLLAGTFMTRAAEREGRGPRKIAPEALAILESYHWPGNVRELQNVIERALALGRGSVLDVEDLPESLVEEQRRGLIREDVESGYLPLSEATRRFERELLREALDKARWNQTRAAEALGITRRVLKLKMDRYGLNTAPPSH